jgi:hypothetical protein
VEDERQVAVDLFNHVWTLLELTPRTPQQDAEMLHAAHASCHHWMRVGAPVNAVRGEWQVSRVYAVLGRGEPALFHARRCLDLATLHGIGDWDLAYAHEAVSRAAAVAGDEDEARRSAGLARRAAEAVADPDDLEHLLEDLATLPVQA